MARPRKGAPRPQCAVCGRETDQKVTANVGPNTYAVATNRAKDERMSDFAHIEAFICFDCAPAVSHCLTQAAMAYNERIRVHISSSKNPPALVRATAPPGATIEQLSAFYDDPVPSLRRTAAGTATEVRGGGTVSVHADGRSAARVP